MLRPVPTWEVTALEASGLFPSMPVSPRNSSPFQMILKRASMPRNLERKSNEELVEAFAKAAKEQGEALDECNPKKANRRTKLISKTFAAMKQRGSEAWQQFLFLLNHPEPYVRYFAATYALRSNPNLALPILERLDREEWGLLAFRAGLALKQWREGKWILP